MKDNRKYVIKKDGCYLDAEGDWIFELGNAKFYDTKAQALKVTDVMAGAIIIKIYR